MCMTAGLDDERLSFLGRRPAPGFALRVLVVAPFGRRAYVESEWRGAVVVVEYGEIVLEPRDGRARRFGRGAVLSLDALDLLVLRNPGPQPAVLSAVARHAGCREPPAG
jgi:hypothetical protein